MRHLELGQAAHRRGRSAADAAHMICMRAFIIRLILGIVILGVLSSVLITEGKWQTVLQGVGIVLGQDASSKVDQFGQASKGVTDAVSGAAQGTFNTLTSGGAQPIDYSAVRNLLDGIPTRPATRIPSYDRTKFGPAWADTDHNGCSTRDDVLARDLSSVTKSGHCTVTSGTLADPYTGEAIAFTRGDTSSLAVQIDHIVPLSYAWQSGAYAWSDDERETFANDEPAELLAVSGPQNTAKSDSGPSAWLPPNAAFQCRYVAKFVAVLVKYELTITSDDRAAISSTLQSCR